MCSPPLVADAPVRTRTHAGLLAWSAAMAALAARLKSLRFENVGDPEATWEAVCKAIKSVVGDGYDIKRRNNTKVRLLLDEGVASVTRSVRFVMEVRAMGSTLGV